ncbi:LLM class flavin-dependent oxidoreductase [Glaciibacter flavus]|uniref:LLM class flavin-dependent oxidoreductase n=1 Tax=Orlajensenia flava TaxID=2565934 RepID=UPI003B007D23
MKFWLHGFPIPTRSAPLARRAEGWGYEGILLADSQLLVGDPYSELALCAASTTTLRLGVGVTNPITRDPSVTASAILTVHEESAGRAILGFGRGDSALKLIGKNPASVSETTRAIGSLKTYLGSDPSDPARGGMPPWASRDLDPVAIDVAATGPRMIGLAATSGDRVTFNMGAHVESLRWAIETAREARRAAGLDPHGVPFGAYVDVHCSDDLDAAVGFVRGSVSIFANFLAEGAAAGTVVPDDDRSELTAVSRSYDEAAHGDSSAPQAVILSSAFVQRFALVGSPEQLIERIRQLESLGLDHLVLVPASRGASEVAIEDSNELIAAQVLPEFARTPTAPRTTPAS